METNIGQATRTNLSSVVDKYEVLTQSIEGSGEQKETAYHFPNFSQYLGYYSKIPELKKAIDALSIWTVGKGFETDARTRVILEHVTGSGKDTILSILFNLFVVKKFNGDAMAEIITDDKDGTLINLKPLDMGSMTVIYNGEGILKRYEQRTKNAKLPREIPKNKILHLMNDRICDEIHGKSIVEACKWVIDARNEAMEDWRRISHRSTIRVMYIDADDTSRLNHIKLEYAEAIKKGELLIIPAKKNEAELDDLSLPPINNYLEWIRYLENFFYQAVGVPRVIANSENFTEASSKVGYLTFEPVYTKEQALLEAEIWDQLGLKIKFNRPPSLMSNVQEDENKNTGQLGFQANDITAGSGV